MLGLLDWVIWSYLFKLSGQGLLNFQSVAKVDHKFSLFWGSTRFEFLDATVKHVNNESWKRDDKKIELTKIW
jgi:hypothetical protein